MPAARSAQADARPAYHHGDLKRVLVDAAIALLAEGQNWDFSLREVARRAGVSHNAPYNHFADKRDLLAAVAASGYETLRARMVAVLADAEAPDAALVAIGVAYVGFGEENPAHYRLMFGPTFATAEGPPTVVTDAAAGAKTVLGEVVARGMREGVLDGAQELDLAVLSAWSIVHGLTMLVIDGLAGNGSPSCVRTPMAELVTRLLLNGLRQR